MADWHVADRVPPCFIGDRDTRWDFDGDARAGDGDARGSHGAAERTGPLSLRRRCEHGECCHEKSGGERATGHQCEAVEGSVLALEKYAPVRASFQSRRESRSQSAWN